MKAFQYVSPRSAEDAVSLVKDGGRFLAGGIDLLGELKEYLTEAGTLVNIKALPGLDQMVQSEGWWKIGGNVTVAQVAQHPEIKKAFPGLHEAAREVGSPQIRNMATVAGNLAQHSRCWYYRQRDITCLKKGGSACHAREGENKYHSLFSGNPCISPVVSNLAVALAALDANVLIQRGGSKTLLKIAPFYARAWDNPVAHHSLDPGDLILEIQVPPRLDHSSYLQVSEKSAFDWALVSCAAAAKFADRKVVEARIAMGAVAPVPYRVEAADQILHGQSLSETLATQVADAVLKDAKPFAQNGYKIPLAHALIRRTLMKLRDTSN